MVAKYLAVCLLFIFTIQSSLSQHAEGHPPFFKAILESPGKDKCLKESGLESLEDLMSEHSKAACFSFCLAKADGYIDDKGKVVPGKFEDKEVFSQVPKEHMDRIMGCMKDIEMKECSDMEKMKDCFKPPKM